jgi:A/G-specific adenine glycosylase
LGLRDYLQAWVKTVLLPPDRWMSQFPTVQDLAAADLQLVSAKRGKDWGSAHATRARNFSSSAPSWDSTLAGCFPPTERGVLALPGGRTTAGRSQCSFQSALAILDGNIKRVLAAVIALDPFRVKRCRDFGRFLKS